MIFIFLDVCKSGNRLLTRLQLLQKGYDCWVFCCDGRDGSLIVSLRGGYHKGDCRVHSNLSHLDMLVQFADWSAEVSAPHS